MRPLHLVPAAALILLAALPALGQYTVAKIVITGGAPYTDAELLSVAAIQPGRLLAEDSLGKAAQALLDTGLFTDASVSLSGDGTARTVEIALKPTPIAKLLPASFENLVWFTPDALAKELHAKIPLYRGGCGDAGTFPDTIQTALQQLLLAKGVTATLSHTIVEPTTEHPLRVVDFKVDTPPVFLSSAAYTGLRPNVLAAFGREGEAGYLARLANQPFNDGLTGNPLPDQLLNPWRNLGYVAAKLADIHRGFTTSPRGIGVIYTARLDAGDIYKVASLTWSATPIYSDADFAHDAKLHPGDTADARLLAATEASIANAYLTQGYMDAYVDSAPKLDAAAHTVAYAFSLVPGDQYHLRSVTPLGLLPATQPAFDAAWQLKPGDLYDALYVVKFFQKNIALPAFATYTASYQTSADPRSHMVDLTITFVPGGRK